MIELEPFKSNDITFCIMVPLSGAIMKAHAIPCDKIYLNWHVQWFLYALKSTFMLFLKSNKLDDDYIIVCIPVQNSFFKN